MERPVGTGTGDEPGSRHSGSLLVLHEDPPATNPAITGLNTDRLYTVAGQPTPAGCSYLSFVFINACGRRLSAGKLSGDYVEHSSPADDLFNLLAKQHQVFGVHSLSSCNPCSTDLRLSLSTFSR